ncbi:uncharacterized protein LOC121367287 [Gigantopelta aegis]|uniref:uncharacterized protein LOC121367287 n=1 Tax=Gigantopelta aegis TaxID=1735272 RepID=UPI001B889B37|nr:uncharacterized protein LOC121367287 [Gigantopelta aegis]
MACISKHIQSVLALVFVFAMNTKQIHVTTQELDSIYTIAKITEATADQKSTVEITNTTLSSRNDISVSKSMSFSSTSSNVVLPTTDGRNVNREISTTASSNSATTDDSRDITRSNATSSNSNVFTPTRNDVTTALARSSESPATPVRKNGYGFDASIIHTGQVSEDQYKSLKNITRYLMFVLPEIGVVLNSVNVVIFSSKEMKNAFSRIIVCLSAAEILSGILKTVSVIIEAAMGSDALHSKIYLNTVKYLSLYTIAVVARTTFCYILLIAAERCLAVVFPLKAKHIKLIKKPVVTCTALLIFVALYHIQMSFKFDVVSYETREHEILFKYALSSYYINYTSLYNGLLTAGDVAFVYIPLFGGLVLNIILAVALRRHRLSRRQLNSTQDTRQVSRFDTQITVTVIVSSVIFIILVLPIQVTELVQILTPNYGMYLKEHFLFLTVVEIESVFYQLAFCTNFLCYYALGANFRNIFNSKVCRCRMLWKSTHVRRGTESSQAGVFNTASPPVETHSTSVTHIAHL